MCPAPRPPSRSRCSSLLFIIVFYPFLCTEKRIPVLCLHTRARGDHSSFSTGLFFFFFKHTSGRVRLLFLPQFLVVMVTAHTPTEPADKTRCRYITVVPVIAFHSRRGCARGSSVHGRVDNTGLPPQNEWKVHEKFLKRSRQMVPSRIIGTLHEHEQKNVYTGLKCAVCVRRFIFNT